MMTTKAAFITAGIAELEETHRLHTALSESFLRQQTLLQRRGVSLSDDLLKAIDRVAQLTHALKQAVIEDDKEITQLRALAETSAMMNSSLDIETILNKALDIVITLTGAERGYIVVQDPTSGALEYRSMRETDGSQGEGVSTTVIKHVLDHDQPMLTDNASHDPRMTGTDTIARYTLRSIMCVPLHHRHTIIGVVYVDNRVRAGAFSERDLNLLTAFANQVAIAIENALLYSGIQASLDEITRVKELTENVFASIASGVITASSDERVITLNQAAALLLATLPEEAIGAHLDDLLPRLPELHSQVQQVRSAGQPAIFETRTHLISRGDSVLNFKISPLRGGGVIQGVAMVVEDLTTQRDREASLQLLTRYLPPGMVENIEQIAQLALGGERREITCMFINTTSYDILTHAHPHEWMETLNVYLEVATDVIHRARGIIDKYMGSEIMVLFNTQLNPDRDHALRAIETAVALRRALTDLSIRRGDTPSRPRYRIGIHTGIATLGNIGSSRRRSFTAIGDTINLCKRIQDSADEGQVIVSHTTADYMRRAGQPLSLIERPPLLAKGRTQTTEIFEVAEA